MARHLDEVRALEIYGSFLWSVSSSVSVVHLTYLQRCHVLVERSSNAVRRPFSARTGFMVSGILIVLEIAQIFSLSFRADASWSSLEIWSRIARAVRFGVDLPNDPEVTYDVMSGCVVIEDGCRWRTICWSGRVSSPI